MGDWNNTFPDLPILEELGAQLEDLAHVEELSASRSHDSSPTGSPEGRARRRRWPAPRPALVALAVIALAVPVALLARTALLPSADQSPPQAGTHSPSPEEAGPMTHGSWPSPKPQAAAACAWMSRESGQAPLSASTTTPPLAKPVPGPRRARRPPPVLTRPPKALSPGHSPHRTSR